MRILITSGPTREPIDPVRYLSNRSSGKMGFALAEAALAAGHAVDLITGPVSIPAPENASVTRIETAQDMFDAVAEKIGSSDAAILCAAVADYRVAEVSEEKIKKSDGTATLTLVENPDILGSARGTFGFTGILVGFAAETSELERHAFEKLQRKGCDLLVANDVSRSDIGFDHDQNEVRLFFADGTTESIARSSKQDIAGKILDHVARLAKGA